MIIRAKSFESWMQASFSKGELRDIAEHGADAGWHGLTYYRDTCKIYNHFKEEIWQMLLEDTESFDCKNPFEFLAGFNRAVVGDVYQFENLMTWYAAERVARQLIDEG